MMHHIHNIRIYYEDTDSGGVVYYANYLKFAERARTEWLRAQGYEQAALWAEHNIGFVVKNCNVEYHKPAYLDDLLEISTRIINRGAASLKMQQIISRANQIIATIEVKIICVDKNMRPQKLLLNLS